MPQIVRLPYISLRVANCDAMTVQSRVPGFVTIGPTITALGVGEDLAVDDERLLPQQVRVERPHVAEAGRLGLLREVDHARGGRVALEYDADVQIQSRSDQV